MMVKNTTNNILKIITALTVLMLLGFIFTADVFASEATITVNVGKDKYKKDDTVAVEVIISAPDNIGTYYVELEFDETRLAYVGGADSMEENLIILTGTGTEKQIKYSISFKATAPGKAGLIVKSSQINNAAGDAAFALLPGEVIPVIISGDDKTETFADRIAREKSESKKVIGSITDDSGKVLYVVDHSTAVPENIGWEYRLVSGEFQGLNITYLTDIYDQVRILYLEDDNEKTYPVAVGLDGSLYSAESYTDPNETEWILASLNAVQIINEDLAKVSNAADDTVYAINENGIGGFYHINSDGSLEAWVNEDNNSVFIPSNIIAVIAAIVIAVVIIILIICIVRRNGKKVKTAALISPQETEDSIDLDIDFIDFDDIQNYEDIDLHKVSKEFEMNNSPVALQKKAVDEEDLDELLSKLDL